MLNANQITLNEEKVSGGGEGGKKSEKSFMA